MGIGDTPASVTLGSTTFMCEPNLRFLGLKITDKGHVLPWRDDFTAAAYGVKGRLIAAGLGNLPIALSKAM